MLDKLVNTWSNFMSGGTTSVILGVLFIFSPIVIVILHKIWNAWQASQAYKKSQDKEVSDSQAAIKDNLSKDSDASKAADAVDQWAENQRNNENKGEENG